MQTNTNFAYTTFDPSVETVYLEDKILQLKGKSDYKGLDKLCFYNDPCAQIDNGAKYSVTNTIEIQRDVKWYNSKFKASILMKAATSGTLIVPTA